MRVGEKIVRGRQVTIDRDIFGKIGRRKSAARRVRKVEMIRSLVDIRTFRQVQGQRRRGNVGGLGEIETACAVRVRRQKIIDGITKYPLRVGIHRAAVKVSPREKWLKCLNPRIVLVLGLRQLIVILTRVHGARDSNLFQVVEADGGPGLLFASI